MQVLPRYSRAERRADAVVHALGLSAAAAACAVLAVAVPPQAALRHALGLIPYAAGLVAMLGCSALYNLAKDDWPAKALLRRLDHAAIFLMIAGTYTPVALLAIGGWRGWGTLAVIWVGAATGMVLKLIAPARVERGSVLAYLLLGWAGVATLDVLVAVLPARDLVLLVVGGLLYSIGVLFHLATRLSFHNAIWHGFVVAAAACHFAVVLRLAGMVGGG